MNKNVTKIALNADTIKAQDEGSFIDARLISMTGINRNPMEVTSVTLTNNTGTYALTNYTFENSVLRFNTDDVPSGTYVLEVVDNNGRIYPADNETTIEITKSSKEGEVKALISYWDEVVKEIELRMTDVTETVAADIQGRVTLDLANYLKIENAFTKEQADELYQRKDVPGVPGPQGEKGEKGEDGISPVAALADNNDGTHTLTIENGDGTTASTVIHDGADGVSPVISVKDNADKTHTVTITNADGTTVSTVISDGKDGAQGIQGADGKTPTISVSTDGYWVINGVKQTTMAKPSLQDLENLKLYVQSRGQNLVTNGTGLMGDNTNFPGFTFKTDEVKVGKGSFYTNISETGTFTSEYIPVDINKTYNYSMYAKSKLGQANQIIGFACFDIDNNTITPENYATIDDRIVTLTQPLKKGDTKVYVTDVTPWLDNANGWTSAISSSRGLLLWGYSNSGGYIYPDNTYSRYSWLNIKEINQTENSITFGGPFLWANKLASDGVFPVGHKLSRTMSGNMYSYNLALQIKFPTDWKKLSGTIKGISKNIHDATMFRHGTASIKPYFLLNRTTADETWINGIDFRETEDNTVQWIDAPLLNGFTGSLLYCKDKNNLVTVKFDVTAGQTVAMHTIISNLPYSYLSNEKYLPIPAMNRSTGVTDLWFNVGSNFVGVTIGRAMTSGHNITGQITYRVG